MDHQLFNLDGGLRAVHKVASMQSAVSHLCVLIQAGSGNENFAEWGMAHFTEHMLFKGTKTRSTSRILNRLELSGGELNAFTTREYTCIHASFLNEHLVKAMELLADMIFNSTFPEKEIEREKGVVLDEIDSYRDMPEESIQDDFDEMLNPGHPLFRNILGSRESVSSFNQKELFEWTNRNFSSKNIIVGLSTNIAASRFLMLTEKYFCIKSGENKSGEPENVAINKMEQNILHSNIPFNKTLKKAITQVHTMLGGPACTTYDPRRPAMLLLNNLLGGPGMSSRLNLEIREKRGICYTIESSYVPFKSAGIFSIYFGTDIKKAARCMSLVRKELNQLCNYPLSPLMLQQAKQRLKGQIALAEEARASVIISICKSIFDFGKADSLPEIFKKVDLVTPEEVIELSSETFHESKLSTLVMEPED